MPNEQMIEAWDGPAGQHWVEQAEQYDRLSRRFAERIVNTLAPQAGERILDVGCGNGALLLATAPIAKTVVGVDISGPMLGEARRRADQAGLANVDLVKADAQVHDFEPGAFDAAMSRFGVMFFDDPVAAFTNIGGAVRPGGRLVFAAWQELLKNEWIMVPAAAALAHVPMPDFGEPGGPGPFSLAEPDRVRQILSDAGFVDINLDEVVEPMSLGGSVEDTVTFFKGTDLANVLMKDVDEATTAAAWSAIADALKPYDTDNGVVLKGTAWLVTARRP